MTEDTILRLGYWAGMAAALIGIILIFEVQDRRQARASGIPVHDWYWASFVSPILVVAGSITALVCGSLTVIS